MRSQLKAIDQPDQLSACKFSLLLGVYTTDNKIERYLRVARGILDINNAMFSFHDEPYFWSASEQCDFIAYIAANRKKLSPYFQGHLMIDQSHENYGKLSLYMHNLGAEHKRLLCFDIKLDTGESIGQVTFFDDRDDEFTQKKKDLLEELTSGLISILQRRSESENFYELYEEQRALNYSKTKFFQIIAHDLRAPFHGLIGFSDVLAHERESLDAESLQNIADYLHDTIYSTYNLLENLLNWAIAEGGRFVYHPINFKVKQASQIVYDVLNTLAVKKNIELIETIPADLTVFADINMITSVIQNLVSNALKFTKTDGTGKVIISACQTDQGVEITVQDTGLGMNEAQIKSVFEPQIKASYKGTIGERGTGLGLVLCKRFVDMNKGHISVSSKKGCGTTFKVSLPKANATHQVLLTKDLNLKSERIETET
ncbi:sensor histidine kinase [Acinetobacter gerneri]|uniref:histidine kinase n=1 Tax=Acinetobacter gerneri DSM 14967 = CIP 107464 = MTCC 9824 TaxID=1120926 RepID=N8Y5V8_9GAMM|nr:HAMP domain-containing sensor histidine kinase [Acinetobacter gerneri]ENV32112.1 hypothetical protein F960_03497 [Acinetobacter gerneri DSM 14967 = CIP 107464 = MTCC 9824]EPR83280.1 putative sensory transduction histidine kinase [Acinetobacter gerneri DSM 14967 = CIP 107464 = MTCC 9824]